MRNKSVSILVCLLISTSLFLDVVNAAKKSSSNRNRGGSSGSSGSRTTPSSYRAPQTNSHARAPNVENTKLTYGSQNSAPAAPQSSNVGWKSDVQSPPAYSPPAVNHGPPPAYSTNNNPSRTNVNEAPPSYQNSGLGSGHLAPQYPQPGHQSPPAYNSQPVYNPQPAYNNQPAYNQQPTHNQQPVYNPQPAYNNQPSYNPQPGYNNQPSYNPQPGYQPASGYPGGVPNGYAVQPTKSSNTNLWQNAAIAGVGGLALYGALKPSDTKIIYVNNGTDGAAPAPAAVDASQSTPTPLATAAPPNAAPVHPDPANPVAANPAPIAPVSVPIDSMSGAPLAPMPGAPLAPMPVPDTVFDPVTNTTVNCRELLAANQQASIQQPGTTPPVVPSICQQFFSTLPPGTASTSNGIPTTSQDHQLHHHSMPPLAQYPSDSSNAPLAPYPSDSPYNNGASTTQALPSPQPSTQGGQNANYQSQNTIIPMKGSGIQFKSSVFTVLTSIVMIFVTRV